MMAIIGFTCASFMCGLAPNLATLIVFRVIQGASGGTMQPLSQAIMLEAFPPEERGKAMAAWAVCIVTAPILGPVLGGWLTDTYSWRWIFYINIPVGIISLIMAKLFVFDPSYLRKKAQGIDYWGIGMLAVGMAALADYARQRPAGGLVHIEHDYHAGGNRGRAAPCIRPL